MGVGLGGGQSWSQVRRAAARRSPSSPTAEPLAPRRTSLICPAARLLSPRARRQSVHGDMQQCRAHADHMASEQQRRDLQLKSEVKQRAALEKQLEVEQREARRNVGNSVMEENKRLMEMRREELKAQKLREIEQDLANLELFNERWGSTPR